MKQIMIGIFLIFTLQTFSQKLDIYRDSSNRFSIGIPSGWKSHKSSESTGPALDVFLPKMADKGILPSYNITLVQVGDYTLDKIYSQFRIIYEQLKDTIKLEEDCFSKGVKFKKLIKKDNAATQIETLVYFAQKGETNYQLSFTTSEHLFPKYEALFKSIFETFQL